MIFEGLILPTVNGSLWEISIHTVRELLGTFCSSQNFDYKLIFNPGVSLKANTEVIYIARLSVGELLIQYLA